MKEELFRKKNLEKMKSPDNMNDYIRVTNPGIWLVLVSVIALLVGVCAWGVYGRIESTVPAVVNIENGDAFCYVTEEYITSVTEGMPVRFADREASIKEVGKKGENGYYCDLVDIPDLPNGFYEGKVVTKSYRPLSFILN